MENPQIKEATVNDVGGQPVRIMAHSPDNEFHVLINGRYFASIVWDAGLGNPQDKKIDQDVTHLLEPGTNHLVFLLVNTWNINQPDFNPASVKGNLLIGSSTHDLDLSLPVGTPLGVVAITCFTLKGVQK